MPSERPPPWQTAVKARNQKPLPVSSHSSTSAYQPKSPTAEASEPRRPACWTAVVLLTLLGLGLGAAAKFYYDLQACREGQMPLFSARQRRSKGAADCPEPSELPLPVANVSAVSATPSSEAALNICGARPVADVALALGFAQFGYLPLELGPVLEVGGEEHGLLFCSLLRRQPRAVSSYAAFTTGPEDDCAYVCDQDASVTHLPLVRRRRLAGSGSGPTNADPNPDSAGSGAEALLGSGVGHYGTVIVWGTLGVLQDLGVSPETLLAPGGTLLLLHRSESFQEPKLDTSRFRQWCWYHWSKEGTLFAALSTAAPPAPAPRPLFHLAWTNPAAGFEAWRLQPLRSIVRTHPNALIHVYTSTLGPQHVRAMGNSSMVRFKRIDAELFRATPLQHWWAAYSDSARNLAAGSGPVVNDYFYSQMSNAIRMAALWRFGGTWVDFDSIVLQNLAKFKNAVGWQDSLAINWAVMANWEPFHPLLGAAMYRFTSEFHPATEWGEVGPRMITRVVREWARAYGPKLAQQARTVQPVNASGLPPGSVSVYPVSVFYPIGWASIGSPQYTDPKQYSAALHAQILKRSAAFHFWNRMVSPSLAKPGSLVQALLTGKQPSKAAMTVAAAAAAATAAKVAGAGHGAARFPLPVPQKPRAAAAKPAKAAAATKTAAVGARGGLAAAGGAAGGTAGSAKPRKRVVKKVKKRPVG